MPPLERHPLLRPVSREHHDGLLLCWKIREGLERGTEVWRIQEYCTHFFTARLLPHFAVEEEAVFPILGTSHPLIARAMEEHRRLTHLFISAGITADALPAIAKELADHIRFEERQLFPLIEEVATTDEFIRIDALHEDLAGEATAVWHDPFWL